MDIKAKYMALIRSNNNENSLVKTAEDEIAELFTLMPFDDAHWSSDSEDDSISEDKIEQASDDEELAKKSGRRKRN